jgi:hypothetical protein
MSLTAPGVSSSSVLGRAGGRRGLRLRRCRGRLRRQGEHQRRRVGIRSAGAGRPQEHRELLHEGARGRGQDPVDQTLAAGLEVGEDHGESHQMTLRRPHGKECRDAAVLESILAAALGGVGGQCLQRVEDQRMLIGAERSLAQPEDIALAVINRDGVQPHRRQRRPQLPAQSLRRRRLRAEHSSGWRTRRQRILWLQYLPHRGPRSSCRAAFRVTAYSRRRREVGLVRARRADCHEARRSGEPHGCCAGSAADRAARLRSFD